MTVREADGVLRAPGIGDDARGLAALLSVIEAMNANALRTFGDVMLVGTLGEEELGNLRGVKALFRDHKNGIPAVTVGGGEGGNWHSFNEWYKPTDAYLGPQNALLTLLLLAGMEGVSAPVLPRRGSR